MIPDYKSNAVYMSVWLERDYNEVYTALIKIFKKHRIAYGIILQQRMYGVGIICLCNWMQTDIYAIHIDQIIYLKSLVIVNILQIQ